jgi:hypothetical protein
MVEDLLAPPRETQRLFLSEIILIWEISSVLRRAESLAEFRIELSWVDPQDLKSGTLKQYLLPKSKNHAIRSRTS